MNSFVERLKQIENNKPQIIKDIGQFGPNVASIEVDKYYGKLIAIIHKQHEGLARIAVKRHACPSCDDEYHSLGWNEAACVAEGTLQECEDLLK